MNLTQQQWAEQMLADKDAVILDVRTNEEWNEGIIPNAMHIDIYKGEDFLEEISALDKDKSYYIYCKAGGRSGQACNIMQSLGFLKTFNLEGGFSAWQGDSEVPAEQK